MPRMGSSKMLSHSSTARLLVIMKLDARWRLRISSYRSADCWGGEPVESQVVQDEQVRRHEGPEGTVHRVVHPSLGHGFEEAVGMDEAHGVSGADSGVAQGLGQEALPDTRRSHQQNMFVRVQELHGESGIQ